MEGRSRYSEKQHSTFLLRFKGRVSMMDKSGHIGVASSTTKPIERGPTCYADLYSSHSTNAGSPSFNGGVLAFLHAE